MKERFSFTINNATAGALVFAIMAACFDTLKLVEGAPNVIWYTNPAAIVAAGYSCDHVIDDGTIATNVTCTASNSKMAIRHFRDYIKNFGRQIKTLSVQSSNAAAFNEVIEVVQATPLRGAASDYIALQDFKSVDQTAADKVNVRELNLPITYDTLMMLRVPATTSITISFGF